MVLGFVRQSIKIDFICLESDKTAKLIASIFYDTVVIIVLHGN